MTPHRLPLPPQIMDEPERAILAALEVTLEIAANALIAAYPELCNDDFPRESDRPARWADRLINCAAKMQGNLAGYRWALSHRKDENDDLEEEDDPPAF